MHCWLSTTGPKETSRTVLGLHVRVVHSEMYDLRTAPQSTVGLSVLANAKNWLHRHAPASPLVGPFLKTMARQDLIVAPPERERQTTRTIKKKKKGKVHEVHDNTIHVQTAVSMSRTHVRRSYARGGRFRGGHHHLQLVLKGACGQRTQQLTSSPFRGDRCQQIAASSKQSTHRMAKQGARGAYCGMSWPDPNAVQLQPAGLGQ